MMGRERLDPEHDALFLRSIVENIPYMIFVKDARDLRFVRFNKAGEELLGYSRSQLLGKNDHDFFPKEEADFFTRNDRDVLRGKIPVEIPEEPIRTRNKGLRYLHTIKIPILDDEGVPRYLLGISEDITEFKKVQADLHQAKENAEAANVAKSAFLARMSHEIRTPMSGIIGMADLALDTSLTDQQKEYLSLVRESAESLQTLLNDILDLSKIEAGKLRLECIAFELRREIEHIAKPFRIAARSKNLSMNIGMADTVPDVIVGDPVRLRQVLVNLLDNAIRFTDTGGINLTIGVDDQADDRTTLHFSVSDTGVGIAADQRAAVFESFTQADSSTTRNYGGSGLGLSISARIVELMGGNIWVDSTEGEGSTFHFTAAFDRDTSSAVQRRDDSDPEFPVVPALRPLRVLVAEDNRINSLLAVRILESEGHTVETAYTGKEAIEAFGRAPFDVILMDLEMPKMGGLEAARWIRKQERASGCHVPIVALTAHALPAFRAQCEAAGMDGFVAKPTRRNRLLSTIARVLPAAVAEKPIRNAAARRFHDEDLIDAFIASANHNIVEIRTALAEGDMQQISSIAHGMVGAADVTNTPGVAVMARALHDAARDGQVKVVQRIIEEMSTTLSELSAPS